jgi:hypothetical protein
MIADLEQQLQGLLAPTVLAAPAEPDVDSDVDEE